MNFRAMPEKRLTYDEMRALVAWAKERGLISVRPSLEDVKPENAKLKPKLGLRYDRQ